MALWAQKVSGAFEKRDPGSKIYMIRPLRQPCLAHSMTQPAVLTLFDVADIDPDELVSVGAAMFMHHAESVQKLVNNNTLCLTTFAQRQNLFSTFFSSG